MRGLVSLPLPLLALSPVTFLFCVREEEEEEEIFLRGG